MDGFADVDGIRTHFYNRMSIRFGQGLPRSRYSATRASLANRRPYDELRAVSGSVITIPRDARSESPLLSTVENLYT